MKTHLYRLAIASGMLLAACNGQLTDNTESETGVESDTTMESENGTESNTEAEANAEATVVATVNGTEITRAELDERMAMAAQSQGQQPPEDQVLNQLIEEELVMQDAEAKGITVTEEELNTQYNTIIENAGGREALKQQLSQINLSPSALRQDLEMQLLVQKYLESEVNTDGVQVTDAEVQAAYDEIAATQEVPPMNEQVSQQIRQQLVAQKNNELVSAHVEQLRSNANIEVLLNAEADAEGSTDDAMGGGLEGEMEGEAGTTNQ